MSGILICAEQKGTAWAEVKPRAYTSTHLAPDLIGPIRVMPIQIKRGPGHVFLT